MKISSLAVQPYCKRSSFVGQLCLNEKLHESLTSVGSVDKQGNKSQGVDSASLAEKLSKYIPDSRALKEKGSSENSTQSSTKYCENNFPSRRRAMILSSEDLNQTSIRSLKNSFSEELIRSSRRRWKSSSEDFNLLSGKCLKNSSSGDCNQSFSSICMQDMNEAKNSSSGLYSFKDFSSADQIKNSASLAILDYSA